MSDDDSEEDAKSAVELGEGEPVEGAPLARVAARQTWGIEKSTIAEREGDTLVRTPDGPVALSDLLADVDLTYFEHRREFLDAVGEVVGDGPIPTAE